MSNLLLVVYRDSEAVEGFQICSTRELAKEQAAKFLRRCHIEYVSPDFGDYSDWDIGCIWYASVCGLGGSVTIYELAVDGPLGGSPDFPCLPDPTLRKPFTRTGI